MTIYLAVLNDRHTDTEIIPYKSLEGAKSQITKWKKDYDEQGYSWDETEISGWLYYCSGGDDGPSMYIEPRQLMD